MRELIIKPIGGMCNRFNALASALEISILQNRRLTVLWDLKWELNAKLRDYVLDDNWNIVYKDEYNLPLRYLHKFTKSKEKYMAGAKVFLDADMYAILRSIGGYNFGEYFEQFESEEKLYIENGFNFIPDRSFTLKDIYTPTLEIQRSVDEVLSILGVDYIGVHIRRSEHQYSLDFSPDEIFIKKMQEFGPKQKFYFVTDDQSTEDKFRNLFGDQLVIYSKDKRRDTLVSVKSAMVNLMLLSRAMRIFGSYNSTFSAFPAEYGGIELEVLVA